MVRGREGRLSCTSHRKLVSTERRALVILLHRLGSVASSILRDSELSSPLPITLHSIGVGSWEGRGRSESTLGVTEAGVKEEREGIKPTQ